MKSKTDFKQMYLVDATAYNRINNENNNAPFNPIILGRSNTTVEPTALNVSVSAPVTLERENVKTRNASVGTLSDALQNKSVGVMTDVPATIEHQDQSSLTDKSIHSTNEELFDRNLQHTYRPVRNHHRPVQNDYRSARDKSHTSYERYRPTSMDIRKPNLENSSSISSIIPKDENMLANTSMPLQYIAPDADFQREVMDFTTSLPRQSLVPIVPQLQPQLMNYTRHLPVQYSAPPALPQTQSQLMNHTTNLPIQYFTPPALSQTQTQPQLMDYTTNFPIQNSASSALSQTQPQLMDYTTTFPIQYSAPPALPQAQPQLMDYSTNPSIEHTSSLALPPPVQDDCEDCAVTEYKKYSVDLPFARGLPNNVLFTCTLCETNFDTKKSLQRHMKNMHDAFNQVEKGIKRKAKEEKTDLKKVKTSHEVVPYLMYE